MEKKKYKTEETGHYSGVIPKMTVMQPTVLNVSDPPARESVSSQGLKSDVKFSPISESSYDGIKGSFLLDDELAHFVSTKRMEDGSLMDNLENARRIKESIHTDDVIPFSGLDSDK